MNRLVEVTVEVDPDAVLSELDDDELIQELASRDQFNFEPLYQALANGRNDEALRLARELTQEATGRVLP